MSAASRFSTVVRAHVVAREEEPRVESLRGSGMRFGS